MATLTIESYLEMCEAIRLAFEPLRRLGEEFCSKFYENLESAGYDIDAFVENGELKLLDNGQA